MSEQLEQKPKRKYVKSGKYSKKNKATNNEGVKTPDTEVKDTQTPNIETNNTPTPEANTPKTNEGEKIEPKFELPKVETDEVFIKPIEVINEEMGGNESEPSDEDAGGGIDHSIMAVLLVNLLGIVLIVITNKFAKEKQSISDAQLTEDEEEYIQALFQKAYGDVELADPKTMFWMAVLVISASKVDFSKFKK